MNFLIVSPPAQFPSGNLCTATQWAGVLEELGHQVRQTESYQGEDAEVLIALHAAKNHSALVEFRDQHPGGKTIVVLTGTDIYPQPSRQSLDSMRLADCLVALQPAAQKAVPVEFQNKLSIIVQSAVADTSNRPEPDPCVFDVCVVGHLREVKDPMRTAAAARLLPAESRVRIRHAGRILEDQFTALVEREVAQNPRYQFLGELSPAEVQALIRSSRLLILSSHHEGGARVLGEALAAGTPVLAARNDATESLLHSDYPGLFEAGDSDQLAALMNRAESERAFLAALTEKAHALAFQFDPGREREAWRRLLANLHRETIASHPSRRTGTV